MLFDVENFVSDPIIEELNSLNKTDLFQSVQHYKLMADVSFNKLQVKEGVLKYLLDEASNETASRTTAVGGMTGEELLQLK